MTRSCFSILVVFLVCLTGCVTTSDGAPTPTSAQRYLKLRGYDFDQKGFFAAGAAQDIAAINAFIAGGFNLNVQDPRDGRTVLITAAARGESAVVKALVDGKADINVKDNVGYTALFHALDARYDEIAELLVNQPGLDLNARGKNGVTLLHRFVWLDRIDIVKNLVERGADVNAQDGDGDIALHGAAESGNVEMMDVLMKKGTDVNAKNKVGGTPLMWAAVYGNEEAVLKLLRNKADLNSKDVEGMTALDWAIKNKRTKVIETLKTWRAH
jgi:ankyrin repeat protein